ncbi:SPOR domain-containing protein [Vibrio sp. RC27]
MANKDYVKRGGGRSKQSATKKKPKSKGLPIRSGLTAIVVVCLFGYGLTFLSQSPDPQPTVKIAPAPVVKPKPKPKEENLPPPPTQTWEYEQLLPSNEIEVTARELQVSEIPYIMQCGAYKTAAHAQERKANIAFQGIQSTVRQKEGSSWFRVVLGPYKFKRDAERDKHKLQRAKIEPCAIWKEAQN